MPQGHRARARLVERPIPSKEIRPFSWLQGTAALSSLECPRGTIRAVNAAAFLSRSPEFHRCKAKSLPVGGQGCTGMHALANAEVIAEVEVVHRLKILLLWGESVPAINHDRQSTRVLHRDKH